eukprot:2187756-Amphidinium_carterae.1
MCVCNTSACDSVLDVEDEGHKGESDADVLHAVASVMHNFCKASHTRGRLTSVGRQKEAKQTQRSNPSPIRRFFPRLCRESPVIQDSMKL